MSLSPAEAYSRSRLNRQFPHLAEFSDRYAFALDDFQIAACQATEAGRGVLVAAPTGSGKTVVGEFAVHLALATGRKCFYTTPIKALSNQKYHDLAEEHGNESVGLLTGDNSINGDAPVVVMTTEVLRNMLYAQSRAIDSLGYVVMDEVHYLADRFRGAVWEEVIINLPAQVSIISLSATVSNAEEFGEWLTEVRGDTVTVVEERRPIPLHQHVLVGRRLYPLFEAADPADSEVHTTATTVNRQLERLAREDWQFSRTSNRRPAKGKRRPRTRHRPPGRVEIIERLDKEGLLPAIVFIFSRAGCSSAMQECLDAGVSLTDPDERAEIVAFVDAACADLPDEDLHVLGFYEFREALSRGIAAHHAGMLPTFKECVEALFSRGLVKVIFATETLALGINMPARSVVIERLTKWNGETHANITPGEYTQLTGRAGRRGIDVEGHGVVLWQAGLDPRQLAGLASTRTYPLNSSFQPSYNMAINLVGYLTRSAARDLLEQSFAQFQADRSVVGMARKIRQADEALEGYRDSAQCDLGDFMQYADIRRRIGELEAGQKKARKADQRAAAVQSVRGLKPGDIIEVPVGKWAGLAVVLDPGAPNTDEDPRPMVLTANRHARRLAMIDFPHPIEPLGTMRVPRKFNSRDPAARRDLASALRNRMPPSAGRYRQPYRDTNFRDRPERTEIADPKIAELRDELRQHPCHQCRDREQHARWSERYFKLERDTRQQRGKISQRTNTVARQFDQVCRVLDSLGYLDGDHVTGAGERLKRLYSELDLLMSECLRHHLWVDLTASELAAVVSGLTFESRRDEDVPTPRFPTTASRDVAAQMNSLAAELISLEREHRLRFMHTPDFTFAAAVYAWCEGARLDDVLIQTEMAAGDFVRAMKQLIDAMAQIAIAAGSDPLGDTARSALTQLRRGVVTYASVQASVGEDSMSLPQGGDHPVD